jgi:putative membrane protein
MITAFVFSTLFLVSYIAHHALHGDVRYPLHAALRTVYLPLLGQPHHPGRRRAAAGAGHVLLLALGRIPQHRKVARWTFPLWLYVSVTGVITYVMLRLAQG